MAIVALMLLFALAGGHIDRPTCPHLISEVVDTYKTAPNTSFKNGRWTTTFKTEDQWMGTTTIEFMTGRPLIKVGTTTNKEAVEYNKRVKECQAINGSF